MSNDEKLERCEFAFDAFRKNMQLVEEFTSMAEAREARMLLRGLRPLTSLRDETGPLRGFLQNTYSIGLPMVLVFAATCYETSLKEMYRILKDEELTEKENKAFFSPNEVRKLFGKLIGSDTST